jgi:hypothetical protein
VRKVKSWEEKLREMENKCDFMDERRRKNNVLMFGIEECSRETYFETLKITEGILLSKLKVDVSNYHIECVRRLGRNREKKTDFCQIHFLYE